MRKTFYTLVAVLILVSMGIIACGAKPTPKTITKIVTQEVTREVPKIMPTVAITVQVPATYAEAGNTLKAVQDRGKLICAIVDNTPGFSDLDDATGKWSGFDVDLCRAMAAAIFNDPEAFEVVVPQTGDDRFTLLQNNTVDVTFSSVTWTFSRDTKLGMDFGPITFYDGQGILVHKERNIKDLNGLNGGTICFVTGTPSADTLVQATKGMGIDYEKLEIDEFTDFVAAYEEGKCDAMSIDQSILASLRSAMKDPAAHEILPITLSKEPLTPVVRQGDSNWRDVLDWTVYCTFAAEELGITAANVDGMIANSQDPTVRALLGMEGDYGKSLGLTNDYCARVIRKVGNYGEMYDRNLGTSTPLGLPRGLNALWTDGGLMYSPAYR